MDVFFDELINQGIEIDCSIFPAPRSHGGFEKFPSKSPAIVSVNGRNIKEFPINTFQIAGKPLIFSGGGYFRLMLYYLIKSLTKRSNYVMTYFHPRDFDPNQPLLQNLNLLKTFKSYVGLRGSFTKFRDFINEFTFYDLKTANEKIDWREVPIIKLDYLS